MSFTILLVVVWLAILCAREGLARRRRFHEELGWWLGQLEVRRRYRERDRGGPNRA